MTDQSANRCTAFMQWLRNTRSRLAGQPDRDDNFSEESENRSGATEERAAKDDFPYKGEVYMWINILFVVVLSAVVLFQASNGDLTKQKLIDAETKL